ncbi:indoleacetamide hydrolase [Pseudorhodoplanes sinuspersici]|uniref:Amidase n=1 Tax=Pseudorhodoplanes sinuspersici TaxID=1235591 RepID=A0A1W6ZVF8_9HYPH|nr:indoleacetamide hydrolase [Pseudorhodoplanes sinuspersici]ARQ01296.1 amidase [Pseudorhodoplanes sinuspersici]RKE72976.1 mandelamide amidase [Pseudorhodoplanes sinuspersici]
MAADRTRRTILKSFLGAATGPAITSFAYVAPAMAQGASSPMTAADIVGAIRAKKMSAVDAVQAALARAEQVKHLNALITLNRDGALAAARKVDAAVAAGEKLPVLAGLPIVVKDNINTADMPTSGGTPALQNARPKGNAPSLQKLLDAGAIVIGKTNMHELAFGITSTNLASFAGPVKNPHDESRIPGGSSGGTAAAIAAGIVTCGLGSDTGGSTRIPAALTGTVGLRPSVGNGGAQRRYHDDGAVIPISHTRDTVGPMGRTVADVALLDSVITGAPMPTAVSLRGKRVGIPASFWAGLDSELEAVAKAAREKLAGAGVEFVEADLPGWSELNAKMSFPIALHEPIADIPAYLKASGIEGVTLADIAGKISSPDVKGAFGAIMNDAFGSAYPDAINVQRPLLQKLYATYFSDNKLDAMLFPTTIAPAIPIDAEKGSGEMTINGGKPVPAFATMIRNTDPGSNAGIPGLSLFGGMTRGGLPVGLEIDGPLGSDQMLLALGLAIEAVLGTAPLPGRAR